MGLNEFEAMRLQLSEQESNFKFKLRIKGLVPIIRRDTLFLYKVKSSARTLKLVRDYSETLCDVYSIVTNDEKMRNDFYINSGSSPYFRNFVGCCPSTVEDLYKHYKLDEYDNRDSFLKMSQNKMFDIDPKKDFDAILESISEYYITYVFRDSSKLSALISNASHYFDVDYIASNIYSFLYSEFRDFSSGENSIEKEQAELNEKTFTVKERNLLEEEKIEILRNIFDSFDIEYVYSSKVGDMDDYSSLSIFGTPSLNLIVKFAQHNTELIYNSYVSPIIKRIMSSKTKSLKK